MGTNGGEAFGRIDTPENVMLKGFMGLGKGDQGHIVDEDWGTAIKNNVGTITEIDAYQATESATTTKIHYLTLDLGYDWLRGPGYKVASYNHRLRTDGPTTRSPMWGHGTGVQVEGVLAYDVTSEFSLGRGARYWAMQVPNGTTNFFSQGTFYNQRYAAEQAALFAQGSYKFVGPSD